MTARKVFWEEGDVISGAHFRHLEDWVESLLGLSINVGYGLIRPATHTQIGQATWNRSGSVELIEYKKQGRQAIFSLCNLLARTPTGRILAIDSKKLEIAVPQGHNSLFLFIRPGDLPKALSGKSPILYIPPVAVELLPETDRPDAVPIALIRVEAGQSPRISTDYIAPCSTLASSDDMQRAAEHVREMLKKCVDHSRKVPETSPIASSARDIISLYRVIWPSLIDINSSPTYFLSLIQWFLQELGRQNSDSTIEAPTNASEHRYNVGPGVSAAIAALEDLAKELGAVTTSISPSDHLAVKYVTRMKAAKVPMQAYEIGLNGSLREQLVGRSATTVLVRLKCTSPKDHMEARCDCNKQFAEIPSLQLLQVKPGWYQLKFKPDKPRKGDKDDKLKLWVGNNVGFQLSPEAWKESLEVLCSNEGRDDQ
jgi:hypothetical protein